MKQVIFVQYNIIYDIIITNRRARYFQITIKSQVRVSICDPKDLEKNVDQEEKGGGARKDSIMVPALNFARRMSMKITGGSGCFSLT